MSTSFQSQVRFPRMNRKKETDLKDFKGHMLTTFKLRGRATKLGYVRGEAEDGGCFYL